MISAIRNRFGSKLLDFFIWLSIIVFIGLYLIPSGQNANRNTEWALDVNNEIMPYNEYRLVLENQNKSGHKGLDQQKAVLEALTNMLLLRSLANKMNIVISSESVKAKLQKILPGMVNADGSLDLELIKARMGQEGFGAAELDEALANIGLLQKEVVQDLKNETINNILIGSLYVPEFVLNSYYNSEYALKQFVILKANYDRYALEANNQKVSDSELKAFFDQQNLAKKRYWTTELRSGTVWSFKPDNFDIKVTDKQIKTYYDRNMRTEFVKQAPKIQLRRILVATQEQAGQIRAELANQTGKFEDLAKAYSQDTASAAKGGLLDFMGADQLETVVSEAAFELKADGEISEVLQTNKGFEIIQRVAKQKVEFKSLEEVKAQITKKIIAQQFERLFPINARRIIGESAKNPEALNQFAANKKATKILLTNLTKNSSEQFVDKLYDLKKVEQKAVVTQGEIGQIIVLTSLEPAQVQDFEKIKVTVLADYQKEQALKLMQKQLDLAQVALKAGKDAKSVAQEFGLEYEQTQLVNKDHASKLKKDTPLELLWSLRAAGATKVGILNQKDQQNGYLVKLEQVQSLSSNELSTKKSEAKLHLFGAYRTGLDRSFVASLRKNGTIKVNTAIINA